METTIIKWSEGNPGALTFLMEFMIPGNFKRGVAIFSKLEPLASIRGTNLYVLWSDLCDKNLEKVEKLCKNCPNDILVDACSRQDYSGKKLISKYL